MSVEGKRRELTMNLPCAIFSEKQFNLMHKHKFSGAQMELASLFQLNHNVDTSRTKTFKVKDLGEMLCQDKATVYDTLKRFNEIGYGEFSTVRGKVKGKLHHLVKQQTEFEFVPQGIETSLSIGMIFRDGMKLLIESKLPGSAFRKAIAMSFYCDLKTGNLHEKHNDTWGRIINAHRTQADRADKLLTEIGYCQTERDYLVSGRLPYTSYAYHHLRELKKLKLRMENEAGPHNAAHKFLKATELLKYGYGIISEGLLRSKEQSVQLAALLVEKYAPKKSQHISAHLGGLLPFSG